MCDIYCHSATATPCPEGKEQACEFRQFLRVHCRLTALSMLTVRIVVLERSQLGLNLIVWEFGGFENVLRDVNARKVYLVVPLVGK